MSVGTVTGQAAEIYRICLEAQTRARAACRPGVSGAEIDAIARGYITEQGYGQYFTHRTGHGLGLEVLTVEPGIYIPDLGGVRIEDDVVLTATGARVLTQYPRDLLPERAE